MRHATWIVMLSLCLVQTDALAQPHRATAKAVSRADFERLEKKVEDQQRLIDKLIRLQAQYMAQLLALANDEGAPVAMPPPAPVAEPAVATTPAKVDAKPAVAHVENHAAVTPPGEPKAVRPAGKGQGTIVGKLNGAAGEGFVYIEDVVAPVKGSATIKQEGKQFVPRVIAVPRGTTVAFPNMDAYFHNVFSVTPDNSFDLGSYRQGESKTVTLSKAGVVNIYCNMHPQMVGYILVTPSSLFTRAGTDGFYRLTGVPAGHHKVVAWAPNSTPVTSEVDVGDGDTATLEFEIKRGKATPHTNKEGLPYGSYKD